MKIDLSGKTAIVARDTRDRGWGRTQFPGCFTGPWPR